MVIDKQTYNLTQNIKIRHLISSPRFLVDLIPDTLNDSLVMFDNLIFFLYLSFQGDPEIFYGSRYFHLFFINTVHPGSFLQLHLDMTPILFHKFHLLYYLTILTLKITQFLLYRLRHVPP
jgi:hypothetical protein